MPTVVISPCNVVDFPEGGGHCWVYLQYAQGLKQLGCDVYWLESFRRSGNPETDEKTLSVFRSRMERWGLKDKAILYPSRPVTKGAYLEFPQEYVGFSRAEAEAIFASADLLLNFNYHLSPELLGLFPRTALVDIDPGLLQFWISRRQLLVAPHDLYFTTGETVGTPAALFPDCGLSWIRMRPPVCLDQWAYSFDPGARAFTTVSNWDSKNWIVDAKETYENTKRVAFLEFADLPGRTAQPLELALFLMNEQDMRERADLERRGWSIRLSSEVAETPENYQEYIRTSRGEFSCAKRSCMRFQNAWVSDRTLCYLASGKPAVVQNTGPSRILPHGEGMFRFATMEEAAGALEAINSDYERHCRAARQIAESLFDARQVLERVLSYAVN